jgi:hypothetical protein
MIFETIPSELLVTATGGEGQPTGGGDFAHRYVNNLRTDWNDAVNRAGRARNAWSQGNYWEAGKQVAAQTLDNIGLIGDAIAPFRALGGG